GLGFRWDHLDILVVAGDVLEELRASVGYRTGVADAEGDHGGLVCAGHRGGPALLGGRPPGRKLEAVMAGCIDHLVGVARAAAADDAVEYQGGHAENDGEHEGDNTDERGNRSAAHPVYHGHPGQPG